MVNREYWNSPLVLYHSARAFVLIAHVFLGVYLWEYAITLKYDWELLTGRRRRSIASVFYLLCRYFTLAALIIGIRVTNAIHPIDCQPWNYALHTASFGAVAWTSGLLYFRVCAVSGQYWPVVYGLGAVYLADWGMVIYAIYESYSIYIQELFICAPIQIDRHRPSTIVLFAFDVICLVILLGYLLTMHRSGNGSLWKLLFNQGLYYFVAIAVAYLIAAVFIILNLNDALSELPQVFALLVSTLCATRMQRSLDDFVNGVGVRTLGSNNRPGANSFNHTAPGQVSTTGYGYGNGRGRRGSMTVDIQVETQTQQYPVASVDLHRAQIGGGGSEEYDLPKMGGGHDARAYEKGGAYAV